MCQCVRCRAEGLVSMSEARVGVGVGRESAREVESSSGPVWCLVAGGKKVKCKCKFETDFSPARACLTWTGLLLLLLSSSNAFLHQRQYQPSSSTHAGRHPILLIIDKTETPAVLAELGPTEGWDGRKGRPQAKLVPGPGTLQRGSVWTRRGRQAGKGKRQGGRC